MEGRENHLHSLDRRCHHCCDEKKLAAAITEIDTSIEDIPEGGRLLLAMLVRSWTLMLVCRIEAVKGLLRTSMMADAKFSKAMSSMP